MQATKVVIRRSKQEKWELALRVFDPVSRLPHFFDKNFNEITEQTIEVGRRELIVGRPYKWGAHTAYAIGVNVIAWVEDDGCEWARLEIEGIASIQEA